MTDVLTPDQRRKNMSNIKGRNTKPEMKVRKIAHSLGYRYRLHKADLPGKPDLVFPKHRKIIFVHGCFWHMHDCKYGVVKPATNAKFWEEKRKKNVVHDQWVNEQLQKNGWNILAIWECETREPDTLKNKIKTFLTD